VYRQLLEWKDDLLSQHRLLPHSFEQMRPCCGIHGKIFENNVRVLAQAVVEGIIASSRLFAIGQKVVDAIDYQLNLYPAARCLPSLAHEDCDFCLQELMQTLSGSCEEHIGRE